MKHHVRIIGGKHRGRKIPVPGGEGLRPTPDRVRETLFNWLMQKIVGMHCLDLYAGSGALGFEAYSRGAATVTLIEKNSQTYQALASTVGALKAASIRVLHQDATHFLKTTDKSFDLIFLDPPFQTTLLEESLAMITKKEILKTNGFVYVESGAEINVDESLWQIVKTKKTSRVYYALLQAN